MAIKEKGRIIRMSASGGDTLQARPGQGLVLRDVMCAPSSNDTYLTLQVQGTTVGKFRVKGMTGNRLPYRALKATYVYEQNDISLFRKAARMVIPLDIPVAEGETLTLSRYAEAGDVTLIYDVLDPGDVSPEAMNGSRSKTRRYVHGAQPAAAVTATPAALATSLIWTGGPAWPFDGSAVPENTRFRIHAILASPVAKGNGTTNKGYTTFLQMIRNNQVLFDDDASGLPLLGDVSVTAATADYTPKASVIGPETAEYPYPGLWLPEPLEFGPGEILLTNLLTTGAAASGILAAEVDVAYLMEQIIGG